MSARSKIPDEIIIQIPFLYKKLGSKSAVGRELGISADTVGKYLALFDVECFAKPKIGKAGVRKQKFQLDAETKRRMNETYANLRNLTQTANIYKITASQVKDNLTEDGLKILQKEKDDRDALFYYILNLFGVQSPQHPVSNWNLCQMEYNRRDGMSYHGQLLTLKYIYEVLKMDKKKAKGSIGLIRYKYDEAYEYYKMKAKNLDEIVKQIEEQLSKDRKEIKYNPSQYNAKKQKRKNKFKLEEVGEEE